MFIANLGFLRANGPEKYRWKKFGNLWYDNDQHRASLLLHGIHLGMFVAKPFSNIPNPPYLSGDLCVATGEYQQGGQVKKEYLWVGYAGTNDDASGKGVTYWGVLEVNPMPCMIAGIVEKAMTSEGKPRLGLFISLFADDKMRENSCFQQMPDYAAENQDAGNAAFADTDAGGYVTEEDDLPF